jgi:hypothetical protein
MLDDWFDHGRHASEEMSDVLEGDPPTGRRRRCVARGPTDVRGLPQRITLTHAVIEAGLVDEYRLFTYPAVQGRGRRLFPDGFRLEQLTLTGSRSFRSRVTLSTYAV